MFPTCSRCIITISYFYHNNNIMSFIKQFTGFSVVFSTLTGHCGHIDNFSHFFEPLFFLVIKLYQNFRTKSIAYLDVRRLNITISLMYKLIAFIGFYPLITGTKPIAHWFIAHFTRNSPTQNTLARSSHNATIFKEHDLHNLLPPL